MKSFVVMPDERRRLICEQSGTRTGLVNSSVEKDFWVCWTLQKLFTLTKWGTHLTFKGGTSLAKAWKLIERFSEDIDIVIDRAALGFEGGQAPDQAPSKKQRKKRLKALKTASMNCVNIHMLPLLRDAFEQELPKILQWSIEPDPDDADAQTLLFTYPTVFPNHPVYLRQVVKIEIGARSDTDPSQEVEIEPIISTEFPELFPDTIFTVRAVNPIRTFWEKAMLIHEETFRPLDKKKRKQGMARHYYDLYWLIKKGVAAKAALNPDLFQRIAEHRKVYFRHTWVDYSTFKQSSLKLIPSVEHLSDWRRDYRDMQGEMFYGDVPDFDDVMKQVGQFQDYINKQG